MLSYKQTVSFVFYLSFTRGTEKSQRTVSVETIGIDLETQAEQVDEIAEYTRTALLGKFNKFFQPTGWRDDDKAENEWTITAVDGKLINRIEAGLYDDNE